jgi:hypothetical protein
MISRNDNTWNSFPGFLAQVANTINAVFIVIKARKQKV